MIHQKILELKEWPNHSSYLYQRKATSNLISHPSKIMLRVILNQLKGKAEELLAEEQASFRSGQSTVEQTFNSQVIIEKHQQHQHDLFHNFTDFKMMFDSLVRRPVAGPQKLQHSRRTGSSHSQMLYV